MTDARYNQSSAVAAWIKVALPRLKCSAPGPAFPQELPVSTAAVRMAVRRLSIPSLIPIIQTTDRTALPHGCAKVFATLGLKRMEHENVGSPTSPEAHFRELVRPHSQEPGSSLTRRWRMKPRYGRLHLVQRIQANHKESLFGLHHQYPGCVDDEHPP